MSSNGSAPLPSIHLFILQWAIPLLAIASAAAHMWFAAGSAGGMRAVMLAGGLACLLCAVHPMLPGMSPAKAARMVIVMSASSMLVHMGLITVHAGGSGQHQHATGATAANAGSTDHLQAMLALVALELLILLITAVAVRRLHSAGGAVGGAVDDESISRHCDSNGDDVSLAGGPMTIRRRRVKDRWEIG